MTEEELIDHVIDLLVDYNQRHENWTGRELSHLHGTLLKMLNHVEKDNLARIKKLKLKTYQKETDLNVSN